MPKSRIRERRPGLRCGGNRDSARLTKGLEGKATAAAMLQATLQDDHLFNDWEHVSVCTRDRIIETARSLRWEKMCPDLRILVRRFEAVSSSFTERASEIRGN